MLTCPSNVRQRGVSYTIPSPTNKVTNSLMIDISNIITHLGQTSNVIFEDIDHFLRHLIKMGKKGSFRHKKDP